MKRSLKDHGLMALAALVLILSGVSTKARAGDELPQHLTDLFEEMQISEDPSQWTPTERIASLSRLSGFFKESSEALAGTFPETFAAPFLRTAAELEADGRLTAGNLRARYRRARLDMSEAQMKAYEALTRLLEREEEIQKIWGPFYGRAGDLRRAVHEEKDQLLSPNLLNLPPRTSAFLRSIRLRYLNTEQSLLVAIHLGQFNSSWLPTSLQSTTGLDDRIRLDEGAWKLVGAPQTKDKSSVSPLKPSPWELRLLEAEMRLPFEEQNWVKSCKDVDESELQSYRTFIEKRKDLTSLRRFFAVSRAVPEDHVRRMKKSIELIQRLKPAFQRWNISTASLVSLYRAVTADELTAPGPRTWGNLIAPWIERLSPAQRAEAEALTDLMDLSQTMGGSVSVNGRPSWTGLEPYCDIISQVEQFQAAVIGATVPGDLLKTVPEHLKKLSATFELVVPQFEFEIARLQAWSFNDERAAKIVRENLRTTWTHRPAGMQKPWPVRTTAENWYLPQTSAETSKTLSEMTNEAEAMIVELRNRCEHPATRSVSY